MQIKEEARERHTLAVIVDNEPGILARIAGLFTARGYNIESLTVTDISEDDVKNAMGAAKSVGDDEIQKKSGGGVNPESWTHGSAKARGR